MGKIAVLSQNIYVGTSIATAKGKGTVVKQGINCRVTLHLRIKICRLAMPVTVLCVCAVCVCVCCVCVCVCSVCVSVCAVCMCVVCGCEWGSQGCQGWQTQMRAIFSLALPSNAKYGE